MKNVSLRLMLFLIGALFFLLSGCRNNKSNDTRGVGVYPGNPDEDFSPELVVDNHNYRNIARLRPAYHSSSYDYNLTAQLITDGIVIDKMPYFISMTTNQGELSKIERERLFDNNSLTEIGLEGTDIFMQLSLKNSKKLPAITSINIKGSLEYEVNIKGNWLFVCSGSDDEINWTVLDQFKGKGLPGQPIPNPYAWISKMQSKSKDGKKKKSGNPFADFFGSADSTAPKPSLTFNIPEPKNERNVNQSFHFPEAVSYSYYKVELKADCAKKWSFGDLNFFEGSSRLEMLPSYKFNSAWMSAGIGEEWVYVDLGNSASFDKIKLNWINKATNGIIQVSDDALNWNDVTALPDDDNLVSEISLSEKVKGRYVRVLMTEPASGNNYILSELEVYGTGGMMAKAKNSPAISDNCMNLSGGNWVIQRSSEVQSPGEEISKSDYKPDNWVVATVPGTALVSYLNVGALPDPNFADNQLMISESFFNSDFWYRNEFEVPVDFKGERMFLNFDGINWKADVFVNGIKAGHIDGAFIRGKFDVTDLVNPGQKNALAVLIVKNDNIGIIKEQTAISPDKNGGILGADNPTFHASIGWDWIPTIRGRNIGIWNDVYLTSTGSVTIENPFVVTDLALPDTTVADVNIDVVLQNHTNEAVNGILSGTYGDIAFEQEVTIAPLSSGLVKLSPATHPSLQLKNPKLWWPNGYGAPNLYDVELIFKDSKGKISDKTSFKSGVREMAFDEENNILSLYINGRRFIGRGGNWGFAESNLNYRAREYDIAVAYHADMNFTMIRNWVGQIGDDEFYEACDRYGIMIWQDFWLANPYDGPNPNNPEMFMANARDMVKRIRNHPSIALYVGRNEGNPPEVLDTALNAMIKELHPGIHYISHSSAGSVSGGGPYRALPVRDYFLLYGNNKFHSERGMPNVMNYESLKQTLPESALWPQNSQWGLHDYCMDGAQGAASFNKIIEKAFGPIGDAKKFTELAQWINYDGYRGIFEGRSTYRRGMLLWMSHPAWPSMVWQTYDYYFDPTAAYFGCKKGSEPLHIQWNPVYNFVEVVNYNGRNKTGLIAKAQLVNMDGSVQWSDSTKIDSNEDSTTKCFDLVFPESLSSVHFIKLVLFEGTKIISENFYWRGLEDGNYQALNNLPKVKLDVDTKTVKTLNNWLLTTTLQNNTEYPVLMVRLKVVGNKNKERILPVFFNDNFVSLLPGQEKVITMKLKNEDTRGETPMVEVSGFNL